MMLKKKLGELTAKEKNKLFNRASSVGNKGILEATREIVEEVRSRGDEALLELTEKFDGVKLRSLRIKKTELRRSLREIDPELLQALKKAAQRIKGFCKAQMPLKIRWLNEVAGIKSSAIKRVGIYVPSGTAAYPSSALMTIIPAQVAGVKEIVVCTPPSASKTVLAAIALAGADEVYRIGGAQAVTAMAFGTESIKPVDKIFGPGNAFVNAAKMLAASEGVAIDCPAGPSEILIIADESADARLVAADLLAQAEHDKNACPVLVSTSEKLVVAVKKELEKQLRVLPRQAIAEAALRNNGALLLAENLGEAVAFANAYAPEHLELLVKNPEATLKQVENAGAVFLGKWSCEAAGDYAAGPNHVLPTGRLARAYSGLSVESFMKQTTVTRLGKNSLRSLEKTIVSIARAEGLEGHARSVEERFK